MARKPENLAAAGVAERRRESEKAAAEAAQRIAEAVPTPTQAENDLAKVGALDIDDKDEPAGTGVPEVRRVSEAGEPAATYQTRESRPVGRPRKDAV